MEKKLGEQFIKASLIYFGANVTMGSIMTIVPVYRFVIMSGLFARAHAHLGLIGWVSLAIIGFVYYSVIGNSNKKLYSERLGDTGFWLINIGLIAEFITLIAGGYNQANAYMVGNPVAHMVTVPYTMFTIIFAFVMVAGACMTIYNIFKTLNS